MSRVLVLSPHPDDEVLGCGGTLCRYIQEGDFVRVVFLTSGERGGHGRPVEQAIEVREGEARSAARILGIEGIEFWREPDRKIEATRQAVERMQRTIHEAAPDIVYVPHSSEKHADHRATAQILKRALGGPGLAQKMPDVWMYEVWTPLGQVDRTVDISDFIDKKMAAIRAYKSQCNELRFDEAFLGLARYRGELYDWPKGGYAEAFRRMG